MNCLHKVVFICSTTESKGNDKFDSEANEHETEANGNNVRILRRLNIFYIFTTLDILQLTSKVFKLCMLGFLSQRLNCLA